MKANQYYKNELTHTYTHGADQYEQEKWLEAGVDADLTSRTTFQAGRLVTAEVAQVEAEPTFDVTVALQRALEQRD